MKPAVGHYHARMQRVLDHIDRHLDEDLSLDVLSGVAAFSSHHFHRQFSELFGLSPRLYVQLVRMKRASHRLAFRGGDQVIQIALDSSYEAPESFSRAFKQTVGQTPSAFRKQPDWIPWHAATEPLNQARSRQMNASQDGYQVRIVDFQAISVALIEHRGDPALIGDTIRRFIDWRKREKLPPASSATFNIFHNDPDGVAPEDYRLDLCAATARDVSPNDAGVIEGVIPAGRCAMLRLTGSSDNLRAAAHFLYADWLPGSGEELRDFPLFAQRVSFFPDVPEHEAVTDIFLPLQ